MQRLEAAYSKLEIVTESQHYQMSSEDWLVVAVAAAA